LRGRLAAYGRLACGRPARRRLAGCRGLAGGRALGTAAGAAADVLRGFLQVLLERLAQLAAVPLERAEPLLDVAVGRLGVALLGILGESSEGLLQRRQRLVERCEAPRLAGGRALARRGLPGRRLAGGGLAAGRG